MAHNATVFIAADTWTLLTFSDVSNMTFQNISGADVYLMATSGAVAPLTLEGSLHYSYGQGEHNAALSDLFPGVANSNRVYAWSSTAAKLTVSYGAENSGGETPIGLVGGFNALVSATMTRPADTTQYTSGDLVANNVTAGSVVPLSLSMARVSGLGGMVRRVRLRKTGTSITSALFRVHFYRSSPTVSNGDNGVWLTNKSADYVGAVDITCDRAFTDGASGNGVPNVGNELNFTADTYYALIEARGAYTPASAEAFTVELELLRN